MQNVFMARSPIYAFVDVNSGTLNSAIMQLRIRPPGVRSTNWGSDPATYELSASSSDGTSVYFEVSELIKDYISLNFNQASNIKDSNYMNLSGGFFRYPTTPLFCTVDVRFKRTVNGSQQSYFTNPAYGKLVLLGYTSYEFGTQVLNVNSTDQYPSFLKRIPIDNTNTNRLEEFQLYANPDRPLRATKKLIKPIWAPVEVMCAKPWAQNLGLASNTDSGLFAYVDGNINRVWKNTVASSSSSNQLEMFRMTFYNNNQAYADNVKESSQWPQYGDLGTPKFQYNYTNSKQLNDYLDTEENNMNAVTKVYYVEELDTAVQNWNLRLAFDVENRTCFGYEAMKVIFLNRYGAYEVLWYFKNHRESISIKSTKYKRNIIQAIDNIPSYNRADHQNFILDKSATKTIVLNSDWYPEEMNPAFEDLMLSTHVWLQYKTQVFPVVVKDTRFTYKNSKTDGLINHQLTVEMANNYINDIR